jgi:hypothetical protein
MNFRFRHERNAVATVDSIPESLHHMTSEFNVGLCRFVLTCACGARFDTPYIDEALELRELHETMAPLADQLGG